MTDGLPEGWAISSLARVTTKVGSGATPRGGSEVYVPEGIPLIRSQNVHFRGFRTDGLVFLNDRQAALLREVAVASQDVLLNITGASIGRVCLAPDNMVGARVNQHVSIIRPVREALDPTFLSFYLRTPELQQRINSEEYGVTRQALTKGWLCDLEVPLAPVAEQRRIVAKVEELLAHVKAARERLARVPAILKRFRQAVLAAACSGRLTEDWRRSGDYSELGADLVSQIAEDRRKRLESAHRSARHSLQPPFEEHSYEVPEGWLVASVASLCQPERALTYGVIKLGASAPNGVPTLRSSDVRSLRIETAAVKTISPKIAGEYSRTTLKGGEVLVTVRGTLGGVAVVPDDMAGWNVSREVAVLPFERSLDPYYLAFAIASIQSQNWLAEREKGVAYTGINIEDLRLLPLPIPPRSEQGEIVRRVRLLLGSAELAERRLATATAQADGLSQTILSKAFTGELVPTEADLARQEARDYEPALALLERINAERAGKGNGRAVRHE